MKRLFFIVTLAILLAGLVLFGLSDTVISIADTSVPNDEVANGQEVDNPDSASAVITITMYTVSDE